MSIIKIENLSKKYIIGHDKAASGMYKYSSLRDSLAHTARGIARRLRHPLSPNTETTDIEEFWALKDINLEIERGDKVGIIGRNGAGKSTLLKILSRITEPTSGKITLNGRVASLLEVGTGFHPELSGRENIYLNGAVLGMTRKEIKKKFDEIVDFSGVEKFLDTPVKRYSSGMYVRLAFAVAAHLDPEILLIDEVLAVGDAEFQKKCLGKMDEVSKQGRTILFVSHNMGAIGSLCEKTVLLENGSVNMFEKTNTVIASYLNPQKEKTPQKAILDNMRVKGTRDVFLKNCLITDKNNIEKTSFLINENIKITFEIESNFKGNVGFWLIIRDLNNNPILCSHQKDIQKQSISQGSYKVEYLTNGLSLLPGEYKIASGVLDYDYTTFFEWVEDCQFFEVLPAFINGLKYDGRLGLAIQDAKWSLTKI